MTTTTTQEPTVYLVIDGSACAFDENGEVLEAVEWADGKPDWESAGVCDHRGGGGAEGYEALVRSLTEAETNARLLGGEVKRVAVVEEWEAGLDRRAEIVRDRRAEIVEEIAAKIDRGFAEWHAGRNASPSERDHVTDARETLAARLPDFIGTTPEGEDFVADALYEAMADGQTLTSSRAIAEWLYDELTKE